VVFAFEDDYSFGLLSSAAHAAWARRWSSTLEDRLRYTPSSVFATFPWPYPVPDDLRLRVGQLAQELAALRQQLCAEYDVGLTRLYNTMEAGGHRALADLHRKLDTAVCECYGWARGIAQDPDLLVAKLTERNAEIAAGAEYRPFEEVGQRLDMQLTVEQVIDG
jgi:hypothetical protein